MISTGAKSRVVGRERESEASGGVNVLQRLQPARNYSTFVVVCDFFPLHNPTGGRANTHTHMHTHTCIDRRRSLLILMRVRRFSEFPSSPAKFSRGKEGATRPPAIASVARQIARAREIPDARNPAPQSAFAVLRRDATARGTGEGDSGRRAASPRRGARTNDDFSMPRARGDLLAGIRRRARAGGQWGEGGRERERGERERPSGRLANRGSTNRVAVYRRRSVAAWYSPGKLPRIHGVAFVRRAYVCLVRPESRRRLAPIRASTPVAPPFVSGAGAASRRRPARPPPSGGCVVRRGGCVRRACVRNGRARARARRLCARCIVEYAGTAQRLLYATRRRSERESAECTHDAGERRARVIERECV